MAVNRLTADDDLFWKVHRLFGSVLVNQLAWRFDAPLERAVVEALHAQLTQGFLARRVVPTRMPFARPYWAPAIASNPLDWQADPVPADGVVDWLSAQTDADLDPASGRLWRLSAAPFAGGTLLSLVTSHVGADGGAVIFAVQDALARVARGLPAERADGSGRLVGEVPARGRLRSDLADAAGQVRAIVSGIGKAYRARHVTEPGRRPRPQEPRLDLPERHQPAELVLNVPLEQWNSVAAAHAGTANGLMLGTAVGVLGRCGRIEDGEQVRVDIPRSLRVPDDPRGNATTGVPISVPYRKGDLADLTHIRAATKQAISSYGDPATTPALQHLQPVQMVIPDFVARRFVRTSKAPICLCTNLGETAQTVATLGAATAAAVLMRPVIRATETEFLRRTEVGVNMSWSSDGQTVTLSVIAADPDRFPTREALRGYVEEEFAAWGLTPTFW
ncbi:hypothetical protein NDR87_16945 [Nocardia sp. CDC159]|uniref:Uncharacterized protein n=1 Tax=Nocardia pulmonis TaxID=2951408 RepID=A0A9X2E937_9NOCA|nr:MULTISPECIES: hypothetical protein [Nocardia]MCM6775218.1 hypothetical protein [Nocardia pulmonis]MCM6788048.1 hypothetical protein [Nocardia sp. CDC159]